MDERRGELSLTWDDVAERAAVSPQTIYRAINGTSMRTTTKKAVERSLRWESGSIDSILDGGNPTPKPDNDPAPELDTYKDLREMVDALQAQAEELKKRLDGLSQGGENRKAV